MKQLELLSKYRAPLMGIAILMIVFFHLPIDLPVPVSYAKKICECGVDIFLMLSGFGLYNSLNRNPDVIQFYKRRAGRLFPSYIPFIIVWFVYTVIIGRLPLSAGEVPLIIKQFIGNISMLGSVTGMENQFNWYVQTICWFYLLTPVFYVLISVESKKQRNVNIAVICAVLILLNITALGNENVLIPFSRIFIFLLGIIFADMKNRKEEAKCLFPSAVVIMFIGLAMWLAVGLKFYDYRRVLGLEWYPFFFIVPGLSMILCAVFELINKIGFGKKIITFIAVFGGASFEIYLIHIFFNSIAAKYYDNPSYKLICLGLNAAAIVVGIFYSRVINSLLNKNKSKKLLNAKEN